MMGEMRGFDLFILLSAAERQFVLVPPSGAGGGSLAVGPEMEAVLKCRTRIRLNSRLS